MTNIDEYLQITNLYFNYRHDLNTSIINYANREHTNISIIKNLIINNFGIIIYNNWCNNLNKLYLIKCSIKVIPEEINNFINLKELDLSKNKIKNITNIFNLTSLKLLALSNNKINNISNDIKYLSNLENLYLNNNKIINITEIKYLTNLKHLYLSYNKIVLIPPEIKYLSNLINLVLFNNKIKTIPCEIKYLNNLKDLNLSNNLIIDIPKEIKYLTNLYYLDLSFNNINKIPYEIIYLIKLMYFYINNNNIIYIPNYIIYCRDLSQFDYRNNQIENISPIVYRFLNKVRNDKILEVYNDNQNVHNHSIQESIFYSIVNIINQNYIFNYDDIINNIIHDDIINDNCKKLLLEYCDNKDIHSRTQLTFKELLCYVWTFINSLDTNNEIKSILNIEMIDSDCKCFTGRISRLINCLNGFTDLVKINISDNQQIGNIIVLIKEKLKSQNNYSIEKHKEFVINELIERKFNKEIIDQWINFIE